MESFLPPDASLSAFSPFPETNPTSMYFAAQEANDNFSTKNIEFEITKMPPYSGFLPMDQSPPVVDPATSIKKEEEGELLENEVKK